MAISGDIYRPLSFQFNYIPLLPLPLLLLLLLLLLLFNDAPSWCLVAFPFRADR